MKTRILAVTFAAVSLAALILQHAAQPPVHSVLPSQVTAKSVLNSTHRHREWVNVSAGSATVRAFIVYPERSDKAPVVMVTANRQGASDWVRAVADQVAAEGFIAVVPDVLSGLGPNGGDTESFASPAAVVAALDRLGRGEAMRRIDAVREYAVSLPAASGASASYEFSPGAGDDAWRRAIALLSRQTGNHPVFAPTAPDPGDHSAHIMMAMAQVPGGGPRGYPQGKLPELPAGIFTAKSTLLHSPLRKEFVDIPAGNVKLHTWIEYPEGNDKAPVVVVMQHGPGLDDWQRALADQLAQQGFIAIAPDLFSGMGPNGGNYDSFEGPDDVLRANGKLPPEEGIRRYKAARDYGMKLPRANGRSATVGFCAGGGYSFRFAGEVPEINAAVVFYGGPPSEAVMTRIKAPVLAFYGDDDARVTATMEPAQDAMKRLGKTFEAHTYPHATHGFLEYQDVGGNPGASSDSWARTIAFLKQHTK